VGIAHQSSAPFNPAATMSDYRRYFIPGGTYFFTIVTNHRRPLFSSNYNVQRLRSALATVKSELPFDINAAVVLPDHMHFLWALPPGNDKYPKGIGLMKVEFTRSLHDTSSLRRTTNRSRAKHRESDVWQRRFWEHTIRDEHDFDRHFDYIHYNPLKHGLVRCPHAWKATSFHHWVQKGVCDQIWGCNCIGRYSAPLDFSNIEHTVGE
jgi:putative transposase